MEKINKVFILTVLFSMVCIHVYAYSIVVANSDGVKIYYDFINNGTELAVSYGSAYRDYSGTVVLPETVTYSGKTYSVTSIWDYAFEDCKGLTSITIPNSVTSIGRYAFSGCTGLTSITIGNSVTSIGERAFSGCKGLTSITIPNSVTSIGSYAFRGCTGLTSVTIPNSVTSIGSGAFYGCTGLTSVTINSNNIVSKAYLDSSNLSNIFGSQVTTYILGDNVTSIGRYAFYGCTGLTSITIPNSVTSIGSYAFRGCTGLTSVTIPNSVTSIEGYAFYGCSGLKSVTISNSVTSIEGYAFCGCSGLESVTIPNSVTSIGDYAFAHCSGLRSMTIGSGVLSIGYRAFYNAKPIKTIWLTNTPPGGYSAAAGTVNYVANNLYTSLANKTIYPFLSSIFEVGGVKYVPVSPSERTCDAIDCNYDSSAENIHIGETVSYKGVSMSVKELKPYVCYGNSYIKNVNISFKGSVSEYAFYDCTGLQTARISNQGYIGDYAFNGCTKLKTATLGNQVTALYERAFSGCSSLESIIVPDAVTSIGKYAFEGCTSMTSAKIGSGVTEINNSAFSNCSSLTDIQIGSNVTKINDEVFLGCSKLSSIRIPKSVQEIGNSVFKGCIGLKQVVMEDGESSLNLGKWLFSSCPLDSVYIGRNISYSTSSSGYSPFYRNTSLRSVKITDKETEISSNEFYGCTNLQNVYIGDGVTTIGDWAFSGCSSLDFFAIGSSVETIGKEAFSDCTAMTKFISNAQTPPTCGSQALDDINKWTCTLQVPNNSISLYQAAPQWKDFFFIEDIPTGITFIERESKREDRVYDVDGRHLSRMQKGINIIKSSDGTTRKVLVR